MLSGNIRGFCLQLNSSQQRSWKLLEVMPDIKSSMQISVIIFFSRDTHSSYFFFSAISQLTGGYPNLSDLYFCTIISPPWHWTTTLLTTTLLHEPEMSMSSDPDSFAASPFNSPYILFFIPYITDRQQIPSGTWHLLSEGVDRVELWLCEIQNIFVDPP